MSATQIESRFREAPPFAGARLNVLAGHAHRAATVQLHRLEGEH